MSNLLVIDGLPHAVRGGMHSEEKAISTVRFYRNGYHFEVKTSQADVSGTLFESHWLPTIIESKGGGISGWSTRWGQHCHLVITQSLPLLAELSVGSDRWRTLEDYLCTPCYEIKLLKSNNGEKVLAEVTAGPVLKSAFNFQPFPEGEHILDIPTALHRLHASDVIVLDQHEDYRSPPHKVELPDGTIHFYIPYEVSMTDGLSGSVSNASLDVISAHIQAYKNNLGCCLPQVTGVVLTQTQPNNERAVDALLRGSNAVSCPNVAGITLQWVSEAVKLSTIIEEPKKFKNAEPWANPPAWEQEPTRPAPTAVEIDEWEKSLKAAVHDLHDRDIVVRMISTYNIYICPNGPIFGKLGGLSRKAIPQYKQEFLAKREQEAAENVRLANEGQPERKQKTWEQLKQEEKEALEGYKLELGDLQQEKEKDWNDLAQVFDRLRKAGS